MRGGLIIEDGWLSRDCEKKLSPYVERHSIEVVNQNTRMPPITIEGYRNHLAWREQCKELDAVFAPTERYRDPANDQPIFEIDRAHGLFRVLRGNMHADAMRLAD